MKIIKSSIFLLVIASASISLSGCVSLILSGATETAVVVAQERSVGNAIDDVGIMLQIKNLYAKKDYKDLLVNVDIKVVEGRVLLAGNVDKPDSQINAVKLAWKVDGVKEVMNEVQINDKSGIWNYTKDVWISTQVRTFLLFGKNIRSVNYSIITVNQTVYIMGLAQDEVELNRVTNVASSTNYVKQVVSHVRLKSDSRRGYLP